MRVSILAVGSRGDVQPLVALALGLRAAGHEVTITTHRGYADIAEDFGLTVVPLTADAKEVLATSEADFMRDGRSSALTGFYRLVRLMVPLVDSMARESLEACRGADVVIYSFLASTFAHAIGQKLNVPIVMAYWAPYFPSREFPMAGASQPPAWLGPLAGRYNRSTYRVVEQVMWQVLRSRTDRWRREIGLPPVGVRGPFRDTRHGVGLFSFSEELCPRPSDWPDTIHVTGYWYLPRTPGWTPPIDLTEFLANGAPPVVVALGSMSADRGERTDRKVVEALRRLGLRGVLHGVGAGLEDVARSDDMFLIRDVPPDWLFEHASAVLHHGGSGTTAEVARAGLPCVVMPLVADHPFFAQRLHAAGVAPPALNVRTVTVDQLVAAIHAATTNADMRRRAQDLGRRIANEDGIARAVAALEAEMNWAS